MSARLRWNSRKTMILIALAAIIVVALIAVRMARKRTA